MKRFGIGMVILGILMMTGAMGLLVHNRQEAAAAEQSVQNVMVQVAAAVTRQMPEAAREETAQEMPVVTVDGYEYIGYLSIPSLELELPVMDRWSYKKLKTAPCRYAGSLYEDDLVVMAHNYASHFGRLDRLKPGDEVAFTDMTGMTEEYQVGLVEILEPGAVEEMTAGEFDLTLFTCTYGGKSRVTVRCTAETGNGFG